MNISKIHDLSEIRKQTTAFRGQGSADKAIGLLKRASHRWPNHPAIVADMASAYAEMQDFVSMEKYIAKLLQVSSDDAANLKFIADLRYSMRRVDSALTAYKQLSGIAPKSLECWLKIAEIQERQGHLDQAQEALDQALKLDATSEEGRFMQALVTFRRGQWEEAGQQFYDLLTSGLRNRELHWKAGHQLAATLEKQGDYKNSMLVLQASKAGMENDYPKEIKLARDAFETKSASIRQLTEEITRKDIERWRTESEGDLPVSVLAGHPRSGTTLLESLLVRHSGITNLEETTLMENAVFRSVYGVAAAKPGLFDVGFLNERRKGSRPKAQSFYLQAVRRYLVDAPDENQLILDKNPILTHFLGVMACFFPGMKTIIALRDPRDVCLSCFQQSVGIATSNVSWLRIKDTMKSYNDIMGVWLKMRQILPDGWLEVRYEDLVSNTEKVSAQVLGFLALPWEDVLVAPSESRTIFSPTYADAARPVYQSSVRRWEVYDEFLSPHLPILSSSIKTLGY